MGKRVGTCLEVCIRAWSVWLEAGEIWARREVGAIWAGREAPGLARKDGSKGGAGLVVRGGLELGEEDAGPSAGAGVNGPGGDAGHELWLGCELDLARHGT
ncbi:hypothetical protein L3X38_031514 [Prunus dulcis]|uniref:Uncharacterized protein n=1 Tax=Prunus dulcis TaxID=3755 RepID=A0AAD4VEJ1_PRUDU|nr:hypothetical protein L3X38_031514 [Prunus dulcis]